MKKHIFYGTTLVLTIFLTQAAWAQSVGLKGGINLASLSQEPFEANVEDLKEKSILGIQAGLVFELPIAEIFAIQPELLWVQKGGKSTYTFLGNEIERSVTYNHIQIPVLAKIKATTDGEAFGLNFFGGPFASFSLGGKAKVTTKGAVSSEIEEDIDYSDDDNYERRLDWGLTFGLGANLGALFLDLRYDLGINNLLDDDASNANNNNKDPYLRTRGLGLTAGFMFGK